jgi:predicted glutamine amidotransferase
MCGIFGFSKRTPVTEAMMPFLAWEMVERGKDSWGVTDGKHILKKLGPIYESWELPKWGDQLIFHTRAGSVGDKTVENQHPWMFKELDGDGGQTGGYVVGVHNGCIPNHKELNKKYNREYEVDSMHVFAHIAEGWPTGDIHGYGALAWFHVDEEGYAELNLARFNMIDLNIFQLDTGEIVFCSQATPVERAAMMCGVKSYVKYKVEDERRIYVRVTEEGEHVLVGSNVMKFNTRYLPASGYTSQKGTYFVPGNGVNHDFRSSWQKCTICGENLSMCTCDEDTSPKEQMFLDLLVLGSKVPGGHVGACCKCVSGNIIKGHQLLCEKCLILMADDFKRNESTFEYYD